MSRWLDEDDVQRGDAYDARFTALAETGADVHGEAAFVDALLPRAARVLDAGCGTGRVAAELARRGHTVTGTDNDPAMLMTARRHPGVTWRLEDLARLAPDPVHDLVVAAGNVVVFLAPGSEPEVVRRLTAQLRPGGLLVSGWRTDLLPRATYDTWTARAGLGQVGRWSTWDGGPWTADADWCVAVDRLALECSAP